MRTILLVIAVTVTACAEQKSLVKPGHLVDAECEAWMKLDDEFLQQVQNKGMKLMIDAIYTAGICVKKLQECKARLPTYDVEYR